MDVLWNALPLSTHFLFSSRFDSYKVASDDLVFLWPFLSFDGITQAYML